MATVRLMPTAWAGLETLLRREMPPNAREQIRTRLRQLEAFPESGVRVESAEWDGARVLFGPWWFVFIYVYDAANDQVSVTAVVDKRSADGARAAAPE